MVVFEPRYPNLLVVKPGTGALAAGLTTLGDAMIAKLQEMARIRKGPLKVIGFENAAIFSVTQG